MNDFDLEAKLKSVRVPKRAEEYWENFPTQVRVNLPRAPRAAELPERWPPPFAWKFGASVVGFALALVVFNEPLHDASNVIFQKERAFRQQIIAFHKNLQVMMTDEHGLHYLIAEKNGPAI